MPQTTAIYLYCVVRAVRQLSLTRVPAGLGGATRPQATRVTAGLSLIHADVPLDIYGPSRLEPRLADLAWIADVAIAHESVVEHFARMQAATVVPMKLFTMFSSLDKAIADVRGRRAAVNRALRHIAGCEEWGIRVSRAVAPASLPTVAERTSKRSPRREQSGVAFLVARRDARDAARAARVEALTAADASFTRLQKLARDARRRDRGTEPGSNPPLLEASFLVPTASRTKFQAEARRQAAACAAAGADMTLTGPWPAYNFVGDAGDRT